MASQEKHHEQRSGLRQELAMNYEDRDTYGMYTTGSGNGTGNGFGADVPRFVPGPALMGADTLVGNNVYNHKGEDLGDIKDIMLDVTSGQVGYAVLSLGAFLGMSEKLFAVPWDALTLDPENKRFVLDVGKDRLRSAPGFDQDQWPDMADPSWANSIHSYYGTLPKTEPLRL
jgi:sporulation protein YlmC with PRC-barrel domain